MTDGVFTEDGAFWSLFDWDIAAIQEKLRQRILAAFVRWSKLSPEVAESLAGWEPERSGFSFFVGPVVPAEDRDGLARLIRYLFRDAKLVL